MSTPATILEWLATAPGVAMNPDGHYGLQCVDLVDQYAQDIFGVPWPQSIGGVTGAKQLLDVAPDAFWIRTDNDPNNPNLIPSPGDVLVFGGSAINEWGHTAVCISADSKGMWVIQQDGFAAPLVWADGNWYSNKPAHKAYLAYSSNGTGPIKGWLTPRPEKLPGYTGSLQPSGSVKVTLQPNQRITGKDPVNIRKEPNSTSEIIGVIPPDRVQTFQGYVVGEMIQPYNVWYKGTDGYVWSGAFTEAKMDGLTNLTPVAPTLAANQRKTGPDVVNIRKEPNTTSEIIGQIPANTVQTFVGYAVGEMIAPFNVWYKGTTGYVWCGAFTTQSMDGLPNVTPINLPTIPPATDPGPVVEPPYGFTKAFDFVEYMPANRRNLLLDNFPTYPEKVVIHQFGTLGVDTLTSTLNTFQSPYLQRLASAHFVVSGKRIIQMVGLKDRAYHAGPVGNDYIGIETDPAQDADTIASTKKLLKALRDKYGYELVKVLHKDVPENNTNCGASITLSNYDLPKPPVEGRSEETIIREFVQFVAENLIQGFLNRTKKD